MKALCLMIKFICLSCKLNVYYLCSIAKEFFNSHIFVCHIIIYLQGFNINFIIHSYHHSNPLITSERPQCGLDLSVDLLFPRLLVAYGTQLLPQMGSRCMEFSPSLQNVQCRNTLLRGRIFCHLFWSRFPLSRYNGLSRSPVLAPFDTLDVYIFLVFQIEWGFFLCSILCLPALVELLVFLAMRGCAEAFRQEQWAWETLG